MVIAALALGLLTLTFVIRAMRHAWRQRTCWCQPRAARAGWQRCRRLGMHHMHAPRSACGSLRPHTH
jgi:hypothetical protein